MHMQHLSICLSTRRREKTLGFTQADGKLVLDVVQAGHVAALLGEHAKQQRLQLVILNGCESLDLGQKCLAHGVPAVVCWSTRVPDEAAYLFVRGFFSKLAADNNYGQDDAYQSAFLAGRAAVTAVTRRVLAADGSVQNEEVPYFELSDPRQGRRLANGRFAGGIPKLLPEPVVPDWDA